MFNRVAVGFHVGALLPGVMDEGPRCGQSRMQEKFQLHLNMGIACIAQSIYQKPTIFSVKIYVLNIPFY
jgi:hypothetical protein